MLSILIPIYNYNCVSLASDLSEQVGSVDVKTEIIFLDDHSDEQYHFENQKISELPLVWYDRLDKNIGRAAIRNELVGRARYEHLLFLDCDSMVVNQSFIARYLELLDSAGIISGGRVYPPDMPSQEYRLHWTYGKERESKPADFRSRYPARYFHTNNFLVHKDILQKYPFDESISGYGYEDLLFAKQLELQGINVKHIDNPVLHAGLDNNKSFISKSKNAVHNLWQLNQDGHALNTRLEKTVKRTDLFGLSRIIRNILNNKEQKYAAQLCRTEPNMRHLDLLKLGWYLEKKCGS